MAEAPSHGGQPIKLKIELVAFTERLVRLLGERENLGSLTTGQQAEVHKALREFYLRWFHDVEDLLRRNVQPASYSLSLQSARHMALLQDQIPFNTLYRTMNDEMNLVAEQLDELVEQLETAEHEQARPATAVPVTATHAPRTFVCHATEDKERFVLQFATCLRARGIDAWMDQWEILGGEGLFKRIFEDAFPECAVFVIVLSENSIDKSWVKLELDTAMVRRLQDGATVIPVVLDGVAVPEALRSLRWITVTDTSKIEDAVDEVVRAAFGIYSRPPLGATPAFVTAQQLVGLNQQDGMVLQLLVRSALERDQDDVDDETCMNAAEASGISNGAYEESLIALEGSYLIEVPRWLNNGRGQPFLKLGGYTRALPALVPNFDDFVARLKATLVNEFPNGTSADELAHRLSVPRRAVIAVLRDFDAQKLVKITESNPRMCHVYSVSPLLGRGLS